jgi:peptidyl-dipeptidase Dcp
VNRTITIRTILLVLAMTTSLPVGTRGQESSSTRDNPFFAPYGTPFNTPPFDRIKNEHFLPAIKEGIRRHDAEIDAVVGNAGSPTFANTLGALDASGLFLAEVSAVFGAMQGANTSPELQGIAREVSPLMTSHNDNIRLNARLFARVQAVYNQRGTLRLSSEEHFFLENTYRDFVRGGALLDEKGKARLRDLNRELALLSLRFGDNVLAETNDFKLVIEKKEDVDGLPPAVVEMAAEAARRANLPGKWVFTVQVPSMTPFLQYSIRRDRRISGGLDPRHELA